MLKQANWKENILKTRNRENLSKLYVYFQSIKLISRHLKLNTFINHSLILAPETFLPQGCPASFLSQHTQIYTIKFSSLSTLSITVYYPESLVCASLPECLLRCWFPQPAPAVSLKPASVTWDTALSILRNGEIHQKTPPECALAKNATSAEYQYIKINDWNWKKL